MTVINVLLNCKNGRKTIGNPIKVNLEGFIEKQVNLGLDVVTAMNMRARLKAGHSFKYKGTGWKVEGVTHILIQPLYSPFEGN